MAEYSELLNCGLSLKMDSLCDQFLVLNTNMMKKGLLVKDLKSNCENSKSEKQTSFKHISVLKKLGYVCTATVVFICILLRLPLLDGMMKNALGIRCFLPNNYFVWEATRPIADCNICSGVNGVIVLPNITREEFFKYAYSYQPILVKGAAQHWRAKETFTFGFFKGIFDSIEGAYENTEEECQFLTFKTQFLSLKDVFSMPTARVLNMDGEVSWYVGW